MHSRSIVFVVLLLVTLSGTSNHAIYLSVIEIDKSSVSIKVFSDDLQDVIRNASEDYIKTSLDDFINKNEELIADYFNSSFKLSINNKAISLSLITSKRENDAHFLYFNFESDPDWKEIKIRADFFMELFPDQSNVVSIIKDGEKSFARFTKSNPSYSFTFD